MFATIWGPEDIPRDGLKQLKDELLKAVSIEVSSRMFAFDQNEEVLKNLEAKTFLKGYLKGCYV